MPNKFVSVFFTLAVIMWGCSDTASGPNIPTVGVNVEITLSNIQYQSLRQVGGYVYLDGGHKGLIVYHESETKYRVWDRICPHGPNVDCEVVEMHSSGFYMQDPCCKSTFDLDGYPTSGPAKYPLVEYKATTDGTYLYINN